MNKITLLLFGLVGFVVFSTAQTYAPAPGQLGSTAIPKDSSCFIAWATGGTLERGYINVADTNATYDNSNRASFGLLNEAFGPAQGDGISVVSLGDSGIITLTFDYIIQDGPGWDFAIFENSFQDGYMELGHVEVSSDGIHFFRFPSNSEIQTNTQMGNGSISDCRYVNNLAGKYRAGYGTPFDVSELADSPFLDKNQLTHVKIIDAIGSINGVHGTEDQTGTRINDPYPTPFHSCGFDLDGVGIMNGTLGMDENKLITSLYPNPTNSKVSVNLKSIATLQLYSIEGKLVWESIGQTIIIDFESLGLLRGTYLINVLSDHGKNTSTVIYH